MGAQGFVGEASEDMGKGRYRGEQGHGAGVTEAQSRGALAVVGAGEHDGFQGGGVGQAGLALAQCRQEAGVGLRPQAP